MKRAETAEAFARSVFKAHPHAIASWYLTCSYLFHEEKKRLVSDRFFDEMSIAIDRNFQRLNHPHKHLLMHTSEKLSKMYPMMVKHTAKALLNEFGEVSA